MTTDQIRRLFLDFFKAKGHEIVPSDSLVPKDDPTLLFTGAGMNQFKEKFLGRNVTYRRAASSQKCLRTGDLENVGKTSGHHTFFEMLGNFSFGDYFKKEAILWAWEFLTQNSKLKTQNLWASVYRDDDEAYNIWKDVIKLPQSKVLRFGAKENFWPSEAPEKGPNGPCGPCSEIFFDYGPDVGCGKPDCTPACDCGRFIEVWNMVFTQFDRQSDGSLKPLPSKNIDTGIGLERLASVIQGVKTNFETDIFVPIVEKIECEAKLRRTKDEGRWMINAIADHIRAVTFAIADGVMPSNEERGYVIRKLIRRASSHGRDIGIKEPFLYKLVSVVCDVMKEPYPEVKNRRDDIAQIVKKEEENFAFVIETQLPRVEDEFESIKRKNRNAELPQASFNFYDTYGMPYEMLEEIAQRHGLEIDKGAFEKLLERQRELSRSKTKIKGEIFSETFAKKVEALGLKTEFLGYEKSYAEAKVLAVLEGGEVVLDRTPFYGESGGQAGDWGKIETETGAMEVEDAKKFGNTIVHIGRMLRGQIKKGDLAKVSIDEDVRLKVMANHTATHLLQAALRKVLGEHVHQTGSLVDADHLRFDFTHMKKLDERELARVEELVNENIKKAVPVTKKVEDIDAARAEGAMALFGEKYDKMVRVVTVQGVSKELCGGTHVDNTKDIGLFRIVSESSIASGVRRIEALTGKAAQDWEKRQKEELARNLEAEKRKEDQKASSKDKLNKALSRIDAIIASSKLIGSVRIIIETIDDLDMNGLRILGDRIENKEKSSVCVLAAKSDDKVSFVVSVTDDLVKRGISAQDISKEFAGSIKGAGGGRPDFAQGGGKNPAKLSNALEKIAGTIQKKLSTL